MRAAWRDPTLRFLIRYLLVTAGLFVVPALLPQSEVWLIRGTLWSLVAASAFVPATVRVLGSTFAIGGTTIDIGLDCTPVFPTLLLIGGMLAYPARGREKLVGIATGAVVLWLYNLLRIYLLIAVLRFAPASFDLVHVYLWQSVTLLAVVGGFVVWMRRCTGWSTAA